MGLEEGGEGGEVCRGLLCFKWNKKGLCVIGTTEMTD